MMSAIIELRNLPRWLTMLASAFAFPLSANAADVANGKVKVAQFCAECHRPKDWIGETTPALESLITDIVSGKINHPKRKLALTPQEIADIAAYWTSGRSQ